MKIGILNTDALKPEFVANWGEYPDMFARTLLAVDPALELVTYEVIKGEYPEDIDEVDGYLITGSKQSVYEDIPWINDLKSFVQKLHDARKKLVGVCFGHQLVAEALGGRTAQAQRGWCVGVHKNFLTAEAAVYGFSGTDFSLISNHRDQVQKVASGGKILARTEACPIAMTALGKHILTLQGHVEFDKEYARALLDMRREILGESAYATAIESLNLRTDNTRIAHWILNFIAASKRNSSI